MSARVGIVLGLGLVLAAPAFALNCSVKNNVDARTAHAGVCGFDPVKRSFAGSPTEQARCLTRYVKEGGTLGADDLPTRLGDIVGKPTNLPLTMVKAFLARRKLAEADLGGAVVDGLRADYFIIHDTSSPNCSERGGGSCGKRGEFPVNRDQASWVGNRTFIGYKGNRHPAITHVMTNRIGNSITMANFAAPIATTKFEVCVDTSRKAGLFVAVESIQPRIGRPAIPTAERSANHVLAPTPGFTAKQYERLALVYVIASARRGKWLIPAFHAVLDQIYQDGHDDPQHFDINEFDDAVKQTVTDMRAS